MRVVVVKLGGAAITNKRVKETLVPENDLESLVLQLRNAYFLLRDRGEHLLLVHGAGSFGHAHVHEHELKQGIYGASGAVLTTRLIGIADTRRALLTLHTRILSLLIQNDIPAVSLPTFNLLTESCDFSTLMTQASRMLQLGLVPLMYGDLALVGDTGCQVVSGDTLMVEAARVFNVDRCIFVTDVAGVYDRNPESSEAKLLTRIDVNKGCSKITVNTETRDKLNTVMDVTGGMAGKLRCATKILECMFENGVQDKGVYVCKRGTPSVVDALLGNPSDSMTFIRLSH
ncbi:uncharacterized protein VTP21DRAFT_5957 [Calcarisporiella thermophila]|uniref:uncharacterized protein n=1 Tax=Calcarisporiella thermophila TaxID=911321 RepID=UPI0037421267